MCSICKRRKAETKIKYSNLHLCPVCFRKLIEKRARETINKSEKLERTDKIKLLLHPTKKAQALLRLITPIEKRYYRQFPQQKIGQKIKVDFIFFTNLRKTDGLTQKKIFNEVKNFCLSEGLEINLHYKKKPVNRKSLRKKVMEVSEEITRGPKEKLMLPINLDDVITDFLYSAFTNSEEPFKTTLETLKMEKIIHPMLKIPDEEIEQYLKTLNIETGKELETDKLTQKIKDIINYLEKEKPGTKFLTLKTLQETFLNQEKGRNKGSNKD